MLLLAKYGFEQILNQSFSVYPVIVSGDMATYYYSHFFQVSSSLVIVSMAIFWLSPSLPFFLPI